MLEVNTLIERGIPFLSLGGILNQNTFKKLGSEINYLLYNQGFQNFVLDFSDINFIPEKTYLNIQNKLVEIFLNCGRVVVCGINNHDKIGYTKDKLFYVNEKLDAFKYLYL